MNRTVQSFRLLALLIAAILAASLLATADAASGPPAWLTLASKRLPQLHVKAAATMTGYARDRFGPAWKDVDHNGCDTRNDILHRDLKPYKLRRGDDCIVARGTLRDVYTGKTIHFVRGVKTSSTVQIDHVVALAAAWRTGAANWTAKRRLAYANDPIVLLAVDGPANSQKSDDDAAEWLPPKLSYDCRYIARQIAIKSKYTLWLTRAEHDEMAVVLAKC